MSTRSHIIVKDNKSEKEHYVYHHCDGYLKGVGEEIKSFTKEDYKPTDFTSDEFCKQLEEWDSSYEYEDCGVHGDEEYIYTVEIDAENQTLKFTVKNEHVKRTESGNWDSWWEEIDEYKEILTK